MAFNKHQSTFARRFHRNSTKEIEQFCASIGISSNSLGTAAAGAIPGPRVLYAIADALGLTADELQREIHDRPAT